MDIQSRDSDSSHAFPPGTILLEDRQASHTELILSPTPSDNPDDPLNWSPFRKGVNFALTCSYVCFTFVLVDINSLAYRGYIAELGLTYATFNMASGSNFIGLALGCLFFLPCVHKFGRRPIYLLSAVVQFACAVWWANFHRAGELIGVSLVAGLAGSISEAVVMITIVDLFFVHQHARLNGVFVFMQSLGTTGGPIACGYIVVDLGWRWMWWIVAIFLGVNLLLVLFFFEESKYVPTLDGRLSSPGRGSVTIDSAKSQDDNNTAEPVTTRISTTARPSRKSIRQRYAFVTITPGPIFQHFYQPLIILFSFPAVAYTAATYGILLAFFSASSSAGSFFLIYPPYDFSPSAIGLFHLGGFIGALLATLTMSPLIDWMIIRLAKRNNGVFEPEMRLWLSIPAALINCAAMLLYGIGLGRGLHWAILAFAQGLFGFGFITAADVALTYLSDSYPNILADALIAVVFIRNGLAAIIRFAFTDWLAGMGIENTFILIGMIALASAIIPILLIFYGKRARVRTTEKYRLYARGQHNST
ncbi:major facilitator superfamily domain-containing protein [Aspergillus cavernicola]|uniref:Major facilitator superfamily domain-containing protein n=1 Tax=Aspergillus cavernicola TaxID=176166 RepID=A0ABR4IFZ7_9EURO